VEDVGEGGLHRAGLARPGCRGILPLFPSEVRCFPGRRWCMSGSA
jgi:hypothetical protein